MSQKLFYICNVIAESEEDYKVLLEYLGNYPVSISKVFPEELYFHIPTLVVGWNFIKNKFPEHNITNKEISKNLSWSFSKNENEKDFFKEVEEFFTESVKKWLPSKFKLYDSYINKESVKDFISENVNISKKTFIYFNEGAMYLYNDGNNFTINIKSLLSFTNDYKLVISEILNSLDIVAFSYHNFSNYVYLELLKDIVTIDSLRWVKYGVETLDSYFNIIPNFKIEKFIPFLMSKLNPIELDIYEQKFYSRMCKRDQITCWLSNREIAFSPEFDNKKLNFKIRKKYKLSKLNFSDKRTITGRITSRDVYNIQNLDKSNDERKNIISRFEGGSILVLDYTSFEPKIALYLSGDKEYIEEYYNEDLHYETAFILYGSDEITPEQRKFAKSINNPLLYGEGEGSLLRKLSTQFSNPEEQLYKVRNFLRPIINKSEELKIFYKNHGYVVTPWGYIIKPEKEFAYFNNYMQTYASEIIIDKLFEIKEFLKSHKTQFLFQVHDSLVFDLHPAEKFLIEKLLDILSHHNNMIFGVSPSIGPNYKELTEIFNTSE